MAASRQQKCALAFAAVCCLLFGGAITTCGFLFQFLDDYDDGKVNGMDGYEYYYTQYWLGIPVSFNVLDLHTVFTQHWLQPYLHSLVLIYVLQFPLLYELFYYAVLNPSFIHVNWSLVTISIYGVLFTICATIKPFSSKSTHYENKNFQNLTFRSKILGWKLLFR